jgi:hypothetical protein
MLTCFQGYVMFTVRASILRCQKIYHSLVGTYYPIKKYNPSFQPEIEYSNGRGPLSFAVLLISYPTTSADTAIMSPPFPLSLTLSSLCRAVAYSPVIAAGGGGGGRDQNNTTAKKPGILQFYCSMVPTTFEIGGRQ